MTNQISTQTISFHGSDLITLKVEDVIYTAVRPIAEALGLSWSTQKRKLDSSMRKFNCVHMNTVAEDGKIRQMLCMPIKKLNGWLFSINPEKVRSDLKEKVICYQEECFEALYNYWHFGKAERKTTVDERTGLRNAVNMLVSKKGLIYSDAYNLVHHYMNVESIEDIPAEKLPMAVEYVHKICLEGELIIDVPKNTHTFELTEDELLDLSWAWFAFLRGIYTFRHIYPAFQRLGSNMAGEIYGQGFEYMTTARNAHKVINRLTQNFQYDYESNWRVLKHIRNFDPTFKQPTF